LVIIRLGKSSRRDHVASLMRRQPGHSYIPTELFRSFIAISEHGSFTKAAEELGLTQPAISAQMKRLQGLLGGDLLIKRGQGVGLTELGSIVESYARRVLALNDQVIAIAGRVPKGETLYIGIQNIFVRTVLPKVVRKLPAAGAASYRFIAGNARYLAEKLRSGYVDLAVMFVHSEARRGLIAEWLERLVWVHAPHFTVPDDEPIPYLSREGGHIDRTVLDLLDQCKMPYRIAFSSVDPWSLAAAAEAGLGVLVMLEGSRPDQSPSLVVAKDGILPKLPEMRAGVFFKEGFVIERHRALMEAFVSAVRPE
jgi:DNA-binding transcriptional LysR family regulator